jgi:hypothetical protein
MEILDRKQIENATFKINYKDYQQISESFMFIHDMIVNKYQERKKPTVDEMFTLLSVCRTNLVTLNKYAELLMKDIEGTKLQ